MAVNCRLLAAFYKPTVKPKKEEEKKVKIFNVCPEA